MRGYKGEEKRRLESGKTDFAPFRAVERVPGIGIFAAYDRLVP